MKRFLKFFFSLLLSAGLMISSVPLVVFAYVNDLLVTDSNALMTLELDESDYAVMPMSSIVSVSNTVNRSGAVINFYSFGSKYVGSAYMNSDGEFSFIVPSGKQVDVMQLYLYPSSMPSAGTYRNQLDFSSHTSLDYKSMNLYSKKSYKNASPELTNTSLNSYFEQLSGDLYLDYVVNIPGNMDYFCYDIRFDPVPAGGAIGGTFSISFTKSSSSSDVSVSGNDTSNQDYQDDVSSSLSDLSSSVDSMTEDLSSAAESLEYISTSQNLIIQGIDNVIMHISDQLYAFWDQLYNLIHLPELDMLTQIKSAIENIDLEVEVNLDKLKTSIDNMSTVVQNKLQSTTDQITGGYDNSGMSSDKTELDGVLDQYEQVEEDLFDDAKGNINDFEFDTPLEQFTGPLSDVSYFLSGLFEAMGPMNVIITFSLTLTIAMVMIGWYRFKGGR